MVPKTPNLMPAAELYHRTPKNIQSSLTGGTFSLHNLGVLHTHAPTVAASCSGAHWQPITLWGYRRDLFSAISSALCLQKLKGRSVCTTKHIVPLHTQQFVICIELKTALKQCLFPHKLRQRGRRRLDKKELQGVSLGVREFR